MLERNELIKRTVNLQNQLKLKGIDGALIIFGIDLYYYAGTRQNSILWVPAEGKPILFVRKSLQRAREECTLDEVRPYPPSKELAGIIGDKVRTIGLTMDVIPVQIYNFYQNLLPGIEFVDISTANREIRSVKSPWEIGKIRESGKRVAELYNRVPQLIKPGMKEVEAAAELEYMSRKLGSNGYIRLRGFNQELLWGMVTSGSNASAPGFFDGPVTGLGYSAAFPQGSSDNVIQENAPILMDYAAIVDGYLVDVTRMFVIGDLEPKLKQAFEAALTIQKHLAENLKPGTLGGDLFRMAKDIADQSGFGSHFMGVPGENAKFVGHGLGLELDELPVLAQGVQVPILENQIIAIEPKFAFPGMGVIGIENTYLVEKNGGTNLIDLKDDIVYM